MTLGERIKEIRKKKKITLVEIEKATGITNSALSLIENNKTDPKASTIKAICEVLEISSDYLLFGEERHQSEKDRLYSLLSKEDKQLVDIMFERAKHKEDQNKKPYTKAGNL